METEAKLRTGEAKRPALDAAAPPRSHRAVGLRRCVPAHCRLQRLQRPSRRRRRSLSTAGACGPGDQHGSGARSARRPWRQSGNRRSRLAVSGRAPARESLGVAGGGARGASDEQRLLAARVGAAAPGALDRVDGRCSARTRGRREGPGVLHALHCLWASWASAYRCGRGSGSTGRGGPRTRPEPRQRGLRDGPAPGSRRREGLLIDHATGVVVGETARVGDRYGLLPRPRRRHGKEKRPPPEARRQRAGRGARGHPGQRDRRGAVESLGSVVLADILGAAAVGVPADRRPVPDSAPGATPRCSASALTDDGDDNFRSIWKDRLAVLSLAATTRACRLPTPRGRSLFFQMDRDLRSYRGGGLRQALQVRPPTSQVAPATNQRPRTRPSPAWSPRPSRRLRRPSRPTGAQRLDLAPGVAATPSRATTPPDAEPLAERLAGAARRDRGAPRGPSSGPRTTSRQLNGASTMRRGPWRGEGARGEVVARPPAVLAELGGSRRRRGRGP